MMKAEPTITLKGIAELLGVTSRTIERTVAQMINGGDIIHEGSKKGGNSNGRDLLRISAGRK